MIDDMNKKRQNLLLFLPVFCLLLAMANGCRKSEYNTVANPAYLRVFNTLSYQNDLSTKGKPVPFLVMVIDPQYDEAGILTGGAMVGDFLDTRNRYEGPASDAASTDYRNREFPGTMKIPVAPIINGFDLSGWAQVPSGKHRFVFYTRPQNSTPFFDLPKSTRQQQTLVADSTLELSLGEVYTMNLLEKEVIPDTLSTIIYLRQEEFQKMAFADSLIYVNFYNLSAKGYAEANPEPSQNIDYTHATGMAIKDLVNIYYTVYRDDVAFPYTIENNQEPQVGMNLVAGYEKIPLQQLLRSHEPKVATYSSIPLFAGSDTTGRIFTRNWIHLDIFPPAGSPPGGTMVSFSNESDEGRIQIRWGGGSHPRGFLLPNLVRQVASGPYAQRSFATISTVEFINKNIYLTSVMKIYTPPGR